VIGAIAKAAKKGKNSEEEEVTEGQAKHEPGFDDLARKIRERYSAAKEQANRGVQQGENASSQPPARPVKPSPASASPRRPVPSISPTKYPAGQKSPMFEVTRQPQIKKPAAYPMQPEQEGPTLRVVKGLEESKVGAPLMVEKPTLQKVEPGLQRVDALTSENAKVSGEVEIHQQHPYLAELAGQYATQDGLRKAILNYEILGPPLALRE
jgi:hypothetical protein